MNIKPFLLKFRRPIIVALHLALVSIAYVLAFYLRFDFNLTLSDWLLIQKTLPTLISTKLIIFGCFGLYTGLWRYASVLDVWRIFKVNILATVCFVLTVLIFYSFAGFPRSVFIIDFILSFCLVAGVRFSVRLYRERYRPVCSGKKRKALIIGAGEAGVVVLREIRLNANVHVDIVGFIDDDKLKRNCHFNGVRVLGSRNDIALIVEKYKVDEIIIAIPSAKGEVIRSIVECCQTASVKIRIIPDLRKILNGELEVKPRDIEPEDLLGRDAVNVNTDEINDYLANKVVMITGAGGSIGSCLCRQIVNFNPKEILLFDHNENEVYYLGIDLLKLYPQIKLRNIIGDIKDIGLLKNVFSLYKPEVIFHAAAHKHVPLMEENPVAAAKNNIIGSRNLTNVMGMTKRVVEMILQAKAKKSNTKFMAVRFGNVLGSNGSVVPLFKKQIEEGGPVTVTHPDVKRYFMSITEASQLVLQAGSMGKAGEIFVLDMGEQIKILDLARELITLYGLKPDEDIKIEFVGLRPGEKLYEEKFLDVEKDETTKADKIYIAQSQHFDPRVLRSEIKELEKMINVMDGVGIVEKLREIITS